MQKQLFIITESPVGKQNSPPQARPKIAPIETSNLSRETVPVWRGGWGVPEKSIFSLKIVTGSVCFVCAMGASALFATNVGTQNHLIELTPCTLQCTEGSSKHRSFRKTISLFQVHPQLLWQRHEHLQVNLIFDISYSSTFI